MVDNIVGMAIGAAIDRSDGDSGVGGAVGGYLVQEAIEIVTPLLITFAIGWGVQYLARRAFQAVTGDDAVARG
ncbi:hypothetical protein [Sphingomonas solaris]|uniref:Uncharacterized protein n=1 Tax=Alterirhizorhabdus solaris TaxID=2529389 RepID=A0A558QZ24_9SPHN|nr:hypothetical protein [Sphingomonas solaris]TVV72348.1 hypothetical protein FOY91_14670 [Sphingomonas solaris]